MDNYGVFSLINVSIGLNFFARAFGARSVLASILAVTASNIALCERMCFERHFAPQASVDDSDLASSNMLMWIQCDYHAQEISKGQIHLVKATGEFEIDVDGFS